MLQPAECRLWHEVQVGGRLRCKRKSKLLERRVRGPVLKVAAVVALAVAVDAPVEVTADDPLKRVAQSHYLCPPGACNDNTHVRAR